MILSRRKFNQGLLALVTCAQSLWLAGCDKLDDIVAWIPIGIAALTNLLNLLGGFGVIPIGAGTAAATLIAFVERVLTDVKADIAAYNANPNSTLLVNISNLLLSISNQISAFVQGLPVPSGKPEEIISALLELILTTIAGFLAQISQISGTPASVSAAQSRGTVVMASHHTLTIEPIHRKKHQFVRQWNRLTESAGHPEADIHE